MELDCVWCYSESLKFSYHCLFLFCHFYGNWRLSGLAHLIFFCELQGFEDMDLEEDKRDIINREIRMFRDMHKVRAMAKNLVGLTY